MNIIRIKTNDIHMFRSLTSRPNIMYSVVEYKQDKFGKKDIITVSKLIKQKLKEYAILAKIIIYSNSIVTTQEMSSTLDYHVYYRDISNATIKNKIRKV
jgi:hypothetical protein